MSDAERSRPIRQDFGRVISFDSSTSSSFLQLHVPVIGGWQSHDSSAMATDGDLSDEQISALLERASARLHAKANSTEQEHQASSDSFRFPRLDAGTLDRPYVSTKGDIASVDAGRLLEERQRKQANVARKVEDPVTAKKSAIEVR